MAGADVTVVGASAVVSGGAVIGAMLGAVLIGTLEQSLFRLHISQFWLNALLGLLILLAVMGDAVGRHQHHGAQSGEERTSNVAKDGDPVDPQAKTPRRLLIRTRRPKLPTGPRAPQRVLGGCNA